MAKTGLHRVRFQGKGVGGEMPDNKTVREALHFSRDVYSEGGGNLDRGEGIMKKKGEKSTAAERIEFHLHPLNPLKKKTPAAAFRG
jgi:hypothetical protein